MGAYFDELKKAMESLGEEQDSIFLGQAVAVAGTAMRNTLIHLPQSKLIELPVEEDFQLGMSIGLAIQGYIPISIYPRWNFLLLAANQIVNHLDKLHEITQSENPPKLIVRTAIGSVNPLHPGPQHVGDFTEAFQLMCTSIEVIRLERSRDILSAYRHAYERTDGVSTILVEWSDKYNE